MKTLKFFTLFAAMLCLALSVHAQTTVNFSVDLSLQPAISTEGVFLAGSFNSWTNQPMVDSEGSGIYSLTLALQPGAYQFKFKNGPDGWENIIVNHPAPEIPGDCVTGTNNDRFVEVGNDEMDLQFCFNYCVDCSVVTEGEFTPKVNNPFIPDLTAPAYWSSAFPTLVDIDADGDLDLYISHRELINPCWEVLAFEFWENEGTSANPSYIKKPGDIHGLPNSTAVVAFVDIDADGDLDAFTSDHCINSTIYFYENTGNATLPQFGSGQTMGNIAGIAFAMFAFGDLDGDGDYDGLVNGLRPAQFIYLENTGTPTAFAFTIPEINPFGLSIPLPNASEWSQFVDWDCDGDLDILNSHWQGSNHESWLLYLHENTGTPTAPAFSTLELLSNQFITGATWGDMDGDGDKDVFSDIFYFENISETGCITSTVNRLKNGAEISLFPNPANDFLWVKMTGEMPMQQITVEVFNSLGVVARQVQYDARDFSSGVQMDVSGLAPGFYTLKVSSGGQFVIGKFLKTGE